MTEPSRTEIDAILSAALERSGEERERYLEQACGGSSELELEVRKLLLAGLENDEFLQPGGEPTMPVWQELLMELAGPGTDEENLDTELTGPYAEMVGPYRIIRQIGRGGMGEVFLARRDDDETGQTVALKLLRPGANGHDIRQRFELERQILATLDHPAIARHIDGGVTDDGRPYIVMEQVQGLPIDAHCDRQQMSLEQRLRLFIDVARAVQHAHRCMVVHRDLKPSNILVTSDQQVKLLDFGIAKLLDDGPGGAQQPLTRFGATVMTPEYASPEQVRGELVTTASDIYQLGIVLYELLTGRRPYRVSGRTAAEIEQIVCGRAPAAPSTVVRQARPEAPASGAYSPEEVSRARATRPERLRARLRGDLDTIVLKALRKEPERRYQSAGELVLDVERHLEGRPISARRDSLPYRLYKFVRRHPIGLASASVILMLVTVMAGFFIHQQVKEHERTRQEAARAEQVAAFLRGLFDVAQPGSGTGETISAKQLLDSGTERVATDLDQQPLLQATLRELLGDMYRRLGMFEQATVLLEQALAAWRAEVGVDHPDLAASLAALGRLYKDLGRYQEAEELYQEALQVQRTLLGEDSLESARSLAHLAELYVAVGEPDKAEPMFRDSLQVLERRLGKHDPEVAQGLAGLSSLYWSQARYDEAEPLLLRALAIHENAANSDARELAIVLSDLGQLYARTGRHDQAEELLRRGHAVLEQAYGAAHPDTAMSLKAIGRLLADQDRLAEAEPLFRKALATLRQTYAGDHPDIGDCLNDLALLYWSRGDDAEAEQLLIEALAMGERTLGNTHPDVAAGLNSLGALYWSQGRLAEAEQVYARALAIFENALGEAHPHVAVSLVNLASLLIASGEHARAEPLCERAVQVSEQALGADHPDVAESRRVLAGLYTECGKFAEAEALLEQSLAALEQAFGPTHTSVAATLASLCTVAEQQGRYDDALLFCRRALSISEQVYGGAHLDMALDTAHLAWVHALRGEPERAEPLLRQALELSERLLDATSPDLVPILNDLAEILVEQEQLVEAEELLSRAINITPEAEPSMTLARRLDRAQTLLILGELRAANGQRQEASRCWRQALEIGASEDEGCTLRSRRLHARALLHLGRVEEARPLVEALLATGASPAKLQRLWQTEAVADDQGQTQRR
jgi:serine/threonine-protein kinase